MREGRKEPERELDLDEAWWSWTCSGSQSHKERARVGRASEDDRARTQDWLDLRNRRERWRVGRYCTTLRKVPVDPSRGVTAPSVGHGFTAAGCSLHRTP